MDEKLPKQGDPGRTARALVSDGGSLVHSMRHYAYKMLELVTYSAPGIGPTKLKAGHAIPQQAMHAPNRFVNVSWSNLPYKSDAADAQMMGLTFSTIGNQVRAKLIREGANIICSVKPYHSSTSFAERVRVHSSWSHQQGYSTSMVTAQTLRRSSRSGVIWQGNRRRKNKQYEAY